LTDEDFADLPLPSARVVDVLQFVPEEQIDPIYYAKSYYLEPESNAIKPYVLLRDALVESDTVGLVKVAIRNREQLATLRVRDGVINLHTMIWPDEVRAADFGFLDQDVELRPQERQMASSLVESMTSEFEPEQYHDQYREALQAVIDAKVEGREIVEPEEAQPTAGNVVDLMSALRASVDAAKKGRTQSAGRKTTAQSSDDGSAAKKSPGKAAKKAAAKKEPAAKSSAKKAPTKKAAAKKSTAKKSTAKSSAKKTARKSA
jgi:DNA end-binding protein Ku